MFCINTTIAQGDVVAIHIWKKKFIKKIKQKYWFLDERFLFSFKFSNKKVLVNIILIKQAFYSSNFFCFSDRLGFYPDQNGKGKKKQFVESYEDYLLSKQSQR
jgi:hypothetical protein